MFNNYRVKYSSETHQLLKLLMDEAKMSTMQRQKVNETLKRGESLPIIVPRRCRRSYADENLFDLKRNYYFMRRTQDQIRDSGAYETEKYRFLTPLVDKEKEKERLGNIMAFGKAAKKTVNVKHNPNEWKGYDPNITTQQRIDDLILEIQDRLIFLEEMTNFGERKKYEDTIKQQIAAKVRELAHLDNTAARKYADTIFQSSQNYTTNIQQILSWQL